jgi:hypothetical protein
MSMRLLAVVMPAVLFTGAAVAQEKVDNPDYANWSKFPKGTSVTRVGTSVEPDGRTSIVTQTLTLVEVAADKVVLEEEYISDVPGATKFKTKPKAREVPKSVQLPAGSTKDEFTTKLPGTVEEGKEAKTVKVPGGEFKAKWFKTVVERGGNRIEGKSWVSDEVPGRIVKVEETTSGKGKQLYTTVREVVEVKKP